MNDLLMQFIYALFATGGFSILFNVPARQIPFCVITGALSWSTYQLCIHYDLSPILACFLASCFVGLFSDFLSKVRKEASTVFIIPGIICLVPGSNIYYTMAAMLESDFSKTASVGTETLLMAGAIAAGLLIIGSLIKIVRSIVRKTITIRKQN